MEIQLIFFNKKQIHDRIANFYIENFKSFKKANPTKRYTKRQLRVNIANALSINGCVVTEQDIKETIINEWKSNGWKEVKFLHWFYAVRIVRKPDGIIVGSIMDALHESKHHNDMMQTTPYESRVYRNKIILKESQLRSIIMESIRKILNQL